MIRVSPNSRYSGLEFFPSLLAFSHRVAFALYSLSTSPLAIPLRPEIPMELWLGTSLPMDDVKPLDPRNSLVWDVP
ncbi:hypothetical protein C8J56DRAFT_1049373 [Mycena floridula]|nr:hypothetical protein C8J56DRAFT_1049373 [Mycena floridula]